MEPKDIILILLTFFSIIISIIALCKSNRAHKETIKLTKKINSKKYQLNEDMYEVVVQIMSVVRAVNVKAYVVFEEGKSSQEIDYTIDYSYEINLFSKILSSPGYLLLLKAIDDDKKRAKMESYLNKLVLSISSKIKLEDLPKIRHWSLFILQQLNYYKVIDIKDSTLCEFIGNLSEMKGILTKEND